jgi:hypothetical protein
MNCSGNARFGLSRGGEADFSTPLRFGRNDSVCLKWESRVSSFGEMTVFGLSGESRVTAEELQRQKRGLEGRNDRLWRMIFAEV